jgi:type IV pilus assembly protein PilE
MFRIRKTVSHHLKQIKKIIGFSLIELMIVISIVGILLVVGIPNYSQHIAQAKRLQAQTYLFRLASAFEQYYIQHNTYEGMTLAIAGIPEYVADHAYRLAITTTSSTNFNISATPLNQQARSDQQCGQIRLNAAEEKTTSGTDKTCWGLV